MKADEHQIESACALSVGGALVCDIPEYTVHRYDGVWFVLWHSPKSFNDLGREFTDEKQLRAFMRGNRTLGTKIEAPRI